MDIKDLNKPQLILLAVLLSFVTSIATGITTVTLMQQAPTSFTAPINRVIQQTVEKIQQVEGKTTVQTIVVKEEDLVVDAIAKNKATIFSVSGEVNGTEVSMGKGFAVTDDGTVAADGSLASGEGAYYLTNESGKFKAKFVSLNSAGFSFLKAGEAVNGTDKLVFSVPDFGDLSKMKAGQKVLVLGDTISSFIFEGTDITTKSIKSNAGAIVLNLDGDILGIALSQGIVPASTITNALKIAEGTENVLPAAPILAPSVEEER